MKGQWIGTNAGSNPGYMTVDVDELPDRFSGIAILTPGDPNQPLTHARILTNDKSVSGTIQAPLMHLHRQSLETLTPAQLSASFPGLNFPTTADVSYAFSPTRLDINWKTTALSFGSANLPVSQASQPSLLKAKIVSWGQFKAEVDTRTYRKFIFRGQENSEWRLRTTYHRSGRADLLRFQDEDIQLLYRRLSGHTRHDYNLGIPDHFGALVHLAQHHGYPTPLLDWSYSPYVAAFFAFRRLRAPFSPSKNIRIQQFDNDAWKRDVRQHQRLVVPFLNFTVLEFIALDNDRLIPQQALSCVSSVDDIETYIDRYETLNRQTYLEAIDIPHSERALAIRDLARMGITAGSMFPGLDGTCEELKEQMFEN
jgi:hypothetical protein